MAMPAPNWPRDPAGGSDRPRGGAILIHILDPTSVLDDAFPILLQLVRFPLFTARIIGEWVQETNATWASKTLKPAMLFAFGRT